MRVLTCCLGAAIVVLVGTVGSASAQTTSGGFGAAPAHPDPADPASRAYFKPVLAPGASGSDDLLITSSSDTPLQLVISPVDGLTGQTSGAVYANRDTPVKRAGTWITPSVSALTLAPHSDQLVAFRVSVPRDAAPGNHLGGLAVEDANPQRSGGQFAVTEVFRTVVGVDVLVPGPASPEVRLGRFGLKALPGTDVAALTVQLGDPGTKLVKPELNVSLRGPSGYRRTVARQLDTILPGDTIAYPFLWPDSLLPGRYHVVVHATGGPRPVERSATVALGVPLRGTKNTQLPSTGGLPLLVVVAGAIVLVVLAGLLAWWWRRRRVRQRGRTTPTRPSPGADEPQPSRRARTAPQGPATGAPDVGVPDRVGTAVPNGFAHRPHRSRTAAAPVGGEDAWAEGADLGATHRLHPIRWTPD